MLLFGECNLVQHRYLSMARGEKSFNDFLNIFYSISIMNKADDDDNDAA